MFCKNCGHDIDSSEKHCPFCGNPSGFPEGMNGDVAVPAVAEAKRIVGSIITDPVPTDKALKRKPKGVGYDREPAGELDSGVLPVDGFGSADGVDYDDYEHGYEELTPAAPFSDDSPTTVFSVNNTPTGEGNSRYAYNEDYVLSDDRDNDGYGGYDDGEYDDYDERHPAKKSTALDSRQIMIIGGVVILVLLFIIIMLVFSRCSNDGDTNNTVTSSDMPSDVSDVSGLISSDISSNIFENAVSFTSSARPSSTPNRSSTPSSSSAPSSSSDQPSSSAPSSSETPPSSETPSSSESTSNPSPEDIGEDTGNEP